MKTSRCLIAGVVLMAAAVVCAAGTDAAEKDAAALFVEANGAFRKANEVSNDHQRAVRLYDKAIMLYEKIISDYGIENPKLYYNLANAYLLKGDLGRAILNYRRAQRLDETDADIRKNLDFALSRRVDKVEPAAEQRVLQTLFFWHYDFSLRTRFLAGCICFAVVCIAASVMVWRGRGGVAAIVVVVCGVLFACFAGSLAVETRRSQTERSGVIVAEQVVAHQADWESSPPSFKEPLHAGTEFDLIEHRPGWLHIRLGNGSDGWIPEEAGELL